MYKDLKWIRLVPDQPGKGGMKTGIHSFQQASVNDTRKVIGFHAWQGAWKIDDGFVAYTPSTSSTSFVNWGLHAYVYPDLTDAMNLPGVTVLGHEQISGQVSYWDYTHGNVRNAHGSGVPVPATFLDIGGRCFAFDGMREGFVMDDRTPAIHAQANQNLGIAASDIALVPGTKYSVTQIPSPYGVVYSHNNSRYLNTPNPNSGMYYNWLHLIGVADAVEAFKINALYPYYSGALMGTTVSSPVITSNVGSPFSTAGLTISCVNGSSKVTLAGGAWPAGNAYCGLAINFAGKSYVIAETDGGMPANVVYDINGNTVTMNAQEAYFLGVYDGPTVTNIPFTITGCQLLMSGTSTLKTGNSAAGTLGYSQSTSSNLVLVGIKATNGGSVFPVGDMNTPQGHAAASETQSIPPYAYAFYDPETGHLSNLSPILTIPDVTAAPYYAANITPMFSIDPGDMSYPQGVDATRFSHLVFFRTLLAGGSTYFPIGSLEPYVAKVHPGSASTRGSWNSSWRGLPNAYAEAPPTVAAPNVWFDYSTDDDLLVTAGLVGPQYTNDKPQVTLRGGAEATGKPYCAAYWDERLWLVNVEEPDKVVFSCDAVQCPFGIPEESFPATNFLRISSEDGKVTGMKLIAEMLLITTLRYAYTVVGSNESNYRLVRVSTRMPGVTTRMMDDFPSDVEGQPSVIYYLGLDKNVYEWVPGMNANVISREINDKLSPLQLYPNYAYVHCVSAWGRRFVAVCPDNGLLTGTKGDVFLFDIEGRRWTQNPPNGMNSSITPNAMATLYGASVTAPITELFAMPTDPGATHMGVYTWVRNDSTILGGGADAEITTFPMTFDGKKSRKQLCVVNVHSVSPYNPLTYTCRVVVDESTAKTYSVTMGAYPDTLYSIYGTPTAAVDGSNPQDVVVLEAAFTGTGAPPTGYRFTISIIPSNPTSNAGSIMAIDIGYRDYAEDGEVDP